MDLDFGREGGEGMWRRIRVSWTVYLISTSLGFCLLYFISCMPGVGWFHLYSPLSIFTVCCSDLVSIGKVVYLYAYNCNIFLHATLNVLRQVGQSSQNISYCWWAPALHDSTEPYTHQTDNVPWLQIIWSVYRNTVQQTARGHRSMLYRLDSFSQSC